MDRGKRALLWLSSAEITAGRVLKLSEKYGGAEGIWDAFGKKGGPVFYEPASERLEENHSETAMDRMISSLEAKNVSLMFKDDPDYPDALSAIEDPPYLLYYAGHTECLRMPMVSVVGSRAASVYGKEMAESIAKGLCRAGVCVVSGLARGIDTAAHRGALLADGCTVGILGSGINNPYPSENVPLLRKIASGKGLIISEYPLDAKPLKYHFPNRNRIISGLCRGTVFVEGKLKSGGILTVSSALSQGREVFAVPGYVGTDGAEGPNLLIREGARLVRNADDILEDLNLKQLSADETTDVCAGLTGTARLIGDQLRIEALTAQAISEKTGLSADCVFTELSLMEISGTVSRMAGGRYSLTIK